MVNQDPKVQVVEDNWELEYLVKSGQYPDVHTALRSALRALFELHPQRRQKMIVTAYERGDLSLGRAADLLGLSQEEFKDLLRDSGCTIPLGAQSLAELHDDVRNA